MRQVLTRVVIPVVLVVCVFFSLPLVCGHDHSHDHGHAHAHSHEHAHSHGHGHSHDIEEPPSYRWSKQANEQYQEPDDDEAFVEPSGAHNNKRSEEAANHPHTHTHAQPQQKSSVWFEAILATLGISIAPYLILFVIPVTNSKEHEPYLKVLLAFASGGLLGDAFLHLIPHALMAQAASGGGGGHAHSHSHSHSHSHDGDGEVGHGHDVSIGLAVLGGIIAFLVVEKLVRIFKGGHMHSHSHAVSSTVVNGDSKAVDGKTKEGEEDKDKKGDEKQKKGEKKKGSKQDTKKKEGGEIKVAGYLNLAADFTHNLTDGLAIGASFLAGKNVGVVTTLTIFLHEIPHEIGDFAILLQSGCSRRKAMMLQLVTAVGALTGTCISLLAEGADESAISWILPFTAGGFIYIATVSVIPELLENTRFWQSVFEIVALLSGVALMMGIAHLEEMEHAL
ncbi:hypothetical protein Pmani_019029 [Petrolisthes manimaculis]|uniref:Solute carrier family 39 member 7 n=1 Tax=Petrolisthes manimaculis TaxID=1843537 RepID=A0AAE1U852_9EUCA|nr:hypothetical protein Pmani_019029 [Petrolisthes manimaculis]